jgi:hypothetical protein
MDGASLATDIAAAHPTEIRCNPHQRKRNVRARNNGASPMRTTLVLIAALLAAGCTPYSQRVANTCARLGAPPGSPHYWECVHLQYDTDSRDAAQWGNATIAGAIIAGGR